MTNTQIARKNMVEGQIRTDGVIVPEIISAFENIPRDVFVPPSHANLAYGDEDIALGQGRYMLEPSVHARMIQALDLKPEDVVLDIGGGTGYGAAVLSSLVSTVVFLENDDEFISKAPRIWDRLGLCNIVLFRGALAQGHKENAPYDAVILNGAVESVPQAILDQLAPKGRLVCVVKEAGHAMGRAVLFQKQKNGAVSSCFLFDAGTPYLAGFEPAPAFRF